MVRCADMLRGDCRARRRGWSRARRPGPPALNRFSAGIGDGKKKKTAGRRSRSLWDGPRCSRKSGAAKKAGAEDLRPGAYFLVRFQDAQLTVDAGSLINPGEQRANLPQIALRHGHDRRARATEANAKQVLMLKV